MESSLKVLIITSRADYGGGPEHIYRLIKYLNDDIRFYIACPDDYPYWEKYSELVGNERMLKIPHRKFRIKDLYNVLRFVSASKIDIVHSHGKGAGIYSRLVAVFSDIPVLHTFHGIHLGEYQRFRKNSYILIEKFLARFTNKFIVVSESEKRQVLDLRITSNSKLVVIKNGVELSDQVVDYSTVIKNDLNVVTITRFDYAKNPELLIPVLEKLAVNSYGKKIKIKTVGSGPGEDKLKRMTEQKNLLQWISFIGTTNNPKEHLMNSFCYISTSRWEGLPLGVLEAMSVGLPVVATDVVGNKDLVENNKTGFLYDINKPEQAAEFIVRLAKSESLWKEFSFAARKKIESDYSIWETVTSTKRIYELMAGRSNT